MSNAIVVLTSKNLSTMKAENGIGYWKAQESRLKKYKYVIATRNRRSNWTQGEEKHRTPFLIGEISNIMPEGDRKLIVISRYAELTGLLPITWKGANPIHYIKDIEALDIDMDSLDWKDWTSKDSVTDELVTIDSVETTARNMLASHYGVEPEQIKISIEL